MIKLELISRPFRPSCHPLFTTKDSLLLGHSSDWLILLCSTHSTSLNGPEQQPVTFPPPHPSSLFFLSLFIIPPSLVLYPICVHWTLDNIPISLPLFNQFLLSNEEAEEFVKEKAAASAKKTAELQEQRTMLIKQMDLLKAMLYQKFGKQINLENADQTRDE